MLYFIYDHTFEGLLTCVFEAFSRKQFPEQILHEDKPALFVEKYEIVTDPEKADRVLKGLRKKISKSAVEMLSACWLSELDEVEMLIFNYIRKAVTADKSIEMNFADPDVLELSKIYRKVMRETERMRQFVRFQKTADGIFFACIAPQYNVLPCTIAFFEDRFADQQWLIYDSKRKYAIYYDLKKAEIVSFNTPPVDLCTGKLSEEQTNEDEIDYQQLWKNYIQSTTIKERLNLKLQRQHMPKRFWKYLPEKW